MGSSPSFDAKDLVKNCFISSKNPLSCNTYHLGLFFVNIARLKNLKDSDISHLIREIQANEEENNSKGQKFELILGTTLFDQD